MAPLWFDNVASHWLQAGVLVGAAGLVTAALRVRDARVRNAFWHAVLALTAALPLVQPWQPAAVEPRRSVDFAASPLISAAAGVPAMWRPSEALLAVVAAGMVLRLAWIAVGLLRLRQLRGLPSVGAADAHTLDEVARELGVTASARLSERHGPLSFGVWRPVVLLPRSFASLDPQTRRAVALHELIHVRRRDWVVALVTEIVVAVLWFHPWAWWVRSQIRLAREEIVDREAAARLGGHHTYAACLLSLAGYDIGGVGGGVAFLRPRELRCRLESLLQEGSMSRAHAIAIVVLLSSVLAGGAAGASHLFPLTAAAAPDMAMPQGDEAVTMPKLIKEVKAVYPPEALQAGAEGEILLAVTVKSDGKVGDITVRQSVPELDQAAVDAVRQWEFEPGRRNGKAVAVTVDIVITFTLKQ